MPRKGEFETAWTETFLVELAQRGIVKDACERAGIHRSRAFHLRSKSEAFARAWQDALDESTDRVEGEIWRRAVDGIEVPMHGNADRTVRVYSDALLIKLAGARNPAYRQKDVKHSGQIEHEHTHQVRFYLPDDQRNPDVPIAVQPDYPALPDVSEPSSDGDYDFTDDSGASDYGRPDVSEPAWVVPDAKPAPEREDVMENPDVTNQTSKLTDVGNQAHDHPDAGNPDHPIPDAGNPDHRIGSNRFEPVSHADVSRSTRTDPSAVAAREPDVSKPDGLDSHASNDSNIVSDVRMGACLAPRSIPPRPAAIAASQKIPGGEKGKPGQHEPAINPTPPACRVMGPSAPRSPQHLQDSIAAAETHARQGRVKPKPIKPKPIRVGTINQTAGTGGSTR